MLALGSKANQFDHLHFKEITQTAYSLHATYVLSPPHQLTSSIKSKLQKPAEAFVSHNDQICTNLSLSMYGVQGLAA
jgi:hypothetical protein